MRSDEVRICGDPFADGPRATALLSFLRATAGESPAALRAGLCVSAVRGVVDAAARGVPLDDGFGEVLIRTRLDDDALRLVLDAARRPVAVTAPLLVFGDPDDCRRAALEWPLAAVVIAGHRHETGELLTEVRRELAALPRLAPNPELPVAELAQSWPPARSDARWFAHWHEASARASADAGTDLALAALARAAPECGLLVVSNADPARVAASLPAAPGVAVRIARWHELPIAEVRGWLLPFRRLAEPALLLRALLSGRPVLASRFDRSAGLLGEPGLVFALGGRHVPAECGETPRFEPDPRGIDAALARLRAEPDPANALAARARVQVLERYGGAAPPPPPAEPHGSRPLVVLEAPLLRVNSASILTIETALALQRRDRIDLRLVPRDAHQGSLATLRSRAPSLLPLLSARPARAELWLTCGWPPRFARPDAVCFAQRFDYEYGALPADAAPLFTDELDRVVVHSRAIEHVLVAAGRVRDSIQRIPHGVDGAVFHERVAPDPRIREWKRGRAALLFVGGLIWRKGIDVLLKVLAERWTRADPVCLVIKSCGADSSYRGYHLGELVERLAAHPRFVETLHVRDELEPLQLASLYRACDLLVHPYRGEGFGLPVLEARACGLPVMTTAGGSTADFCGGDACLEIASTMRPVDLPAPHVSAPWVLEPDPVSLGEQLSQALANLGTLAAAARKEALWVRAAHRWDAAAAVIERMACSFVPARERAPSSAPTGSR